MTMKPGTEPGLEIFSRQWFDVVATRVPEPLREAVREICKAYQLGNTSDPNLIADIISEEMVKEFDKFHVIQTDAADPRDSFVVQVVPTEIIFREDGKFTYYDPSFGEYRADSIVSFANKRTEE